MESNSSAKPIDKNTLHAKVRISHVLVNKPLVIFWKTRTGLNLCNNLIAPQTSPQISISWDQITLSPFCTQKRGAGSAARQEKHRVIWERAEVFPGKQQKQSEQFPLKIIHGLIAHEGFRGGDTNGKPFNVSRAGRLIQVASLRGFVQWGNSYGLSHSLPEQVFSEWWLLERAARHCAGPACAGFGAVSVSDVSRASERLLSFTVSFHHCWQELGPSKASYCCCLKLW